MNVFRSLREAHRILGMNARNLDYVGTYNSRESIYLASDKLKTKTRLSLEGLPTAQTLFVVENWPDIEAITWNELPASFVIKPAR